MKIILFIITSLLSLSAFADGHGHHKSIEISHPYIKITPPGIQNTAAYFTLINHSDNQIELIGVESNAAKLVEIHEHVMSDGLMKMQKIDAIPVEKHSSTEFKPGGYHIMFIGVTQSIAEGDHVSLTLSFSNGETHTIDMNAKEANNTSKHHHKHH